MTMSRSALRMRCTRSMALFVLLCRFHREDVVVLVLEVAGLIRPRTGECIRHGRRLQTNGRDCLEIHHIRHDQTVQEPPTGLLGSPPVGNEDVVRLERGLARVAADLERSELVAVDLVRSIGNA